MDTHVTEEAVRWAYRMILGREPENADVVNDHLLQVDSLATLRRRFLDSSEFLESQNDIPRNKAAGLESPYSIKMGINKDTSDRLVEHIADSWNELGKTEPYWSVLSEPDFMMERIGETKDHFLETGRFQIERLFSTLRRCGIEPSAEWDVFELGCGLGRVTRWLAEEFRSILAGDISKSHLMLAQQINADAPGFSRIQWRQLKTPDDVATLPRFDLFFSVIVLQHNPPPVIAMLLDQIAARLRVDGVAYFQVPTYQRDYHFDPEQYLRVRAGTDGIEMHMLPQEDVFQIFLKQGCVPLEVYEDELSGSRATQRSNTFVFRKVAEGGTPRTVSDVANEWSGVATQRELRAELERTKATLAETENYAQSLESDRNRLHMIHEHIRRRFRWMPFLLPTDQE